jgi:hypothetical protein
MTKAEADLVYEGMHELLKKLMDGSRLGASQAYMDKWKRELDTLMLVSISDALRAGPLPKGKELLTPH